MTWAGPFPIAILLWSWLPLPVSCAGEDPCPPGDTNFCAHHAGDPRIKKPG